jgi:hypothetical protein
MTRNLNSPNSNRIPRKKSEKQKMEKPGNYLFTHSGKKLQSGIQYFKQN